MAIGQHPQSVLSMEQRRGKCVCLFRTHSYFLHILNLSQFYIYRKSRAKKGKAGRPAGSTKGDTALSPSKKQKVPVQENSMNNSPGPVQQLEGTREISTGLGSVARR
jgi:hypothetical protein